MVGMSRASNEDSATAPYSWTLKYQANLASLPTDQGWDREIGSSMSESLAGDWLIHTYNGGFNWWCDYEKSVPGMSVAGGCSIVLKFQMPITFRSIILAEGSNLDVAYFSIQSDGTVGRKTLGGFIYESAFVAGAETEIFLKIIGTRIIIYINGILLSDNNDFYYPIDALPAHFADRGAFGHANIASLKYFGYYSGGAKTPTEMIQLT